jgi:hypothetical protein
MSVDRVVVVKLFPVELFRVKPYSLKYGCSRASLAVIRLLGSKINIF